MEAMNDPLEILREYSRGLFSRLEEFFVRATGQTAQDFSAVADFDVTIRKNATRVAKLSQDAFVWLDTEVRQYQAREGIEAFRAAKELGGFRLVLGGSRFGETQLQSVRGAVLYSDTVLVPDPVMPWLERERSEERFQHVLVLQAAHCLLQLKPLVDADLPYPAVVVFPSWEKLLEEHDETTQEGIRRLAVDLIAWATGEELSVFDEILEYTATYPDRFLRIAEKSGLFVAPGGSSADSLADALNRYESEMRTWRSSDWMAWYDGLPAQKKVLNGIFERVGPIYHMVENAQELNGHPLMCLEQQAHYFRLVSESASNRLGSLQILEPRTTALVNALGSRRLQWLSAVDIESLVNLRMGNENEKFRNRLSSAISRLPEASLNDLNRVAAEACREIDGAIAEHQRDLRQIQDKYHRVHGQTAVLAIGGLSAALMPALAPLLGTAIPLGLAAKYAHDKLAEVQEKRNLTRSLVGVLATVRGPNSA